MKYLCMALLLGIGLIARSAAPDGGAHAANAVVATAVGGSRLAMAVQAPPPAMLAGRWLAGRNYIVLSPAQPSRAPPGKIEVVEVFWYGCPHCYAFDPMLSSWLKNQPSYVDFKRVPVMWGDIHQAHARLFYTLQVLGRLDQLGPQVFAEIHQRRNVLYVTANPRATFEAQLKFAEANGIGAGEFTKAYRSAEVEQDLREAADLDRRYKIDSVPSMVVDGKYESDPGLAGGERNLIVLVNDMIASERR